MKNQEPTPEVKAFATAVLDYLNTPGVCRRMTKDYVDPEVNKRLVDLALRSGAVKAELRKSRYVVEFNGRRLILAPGGVRDAPTIEGRREDGSQHFGQCGVRQAAKVMLNLLPREPRRSLTVNERHCLLDRYAEVEAGAWSGPFYAAIAIALHHAARQNARKLLKQFPTFVHAVLKHYDA